MSICFDNVESTCVVRLLFVHMSRNSQIIYGVLAFISFVGSCMKKIENLGGRNPQWNSYADL